MTEEVKNKVLSDLFKYVNNPSLIDKKYLKELYKILASEFSDDIVFPNENCNNLIVKGWQSDTLTLYDNTYPSENFIVPKIATPVASWLSKGESPEWVKGDDLIILKDVPVTPASSVYWENTKGQYFSVISRIKVE